VGAHRTGVKRSSNPTIFNESVAWIVWQPPWRTNQEKLKETTMLKGASVIAAGVLIIAVLAIAEWPARRRPRLRGK